MNLPDFSKHVELNRLRQQMGAELISWDSEGDWKPIDIDKLLITSGIDISPDQIEYAEDGTLEYEGRKVVVYIRDQYVSDSNNLVDIEELVDPARLCKFHIANCATLEQMKSQNRFDRYVVATRTDGKFIVNFLVGGRVHDRGEKVERRLYVCKNCLSQLNYKEYTSKNYQQKNKIRDSFDLNAFFEIYPSQITNTPTETDVTAPVNEYPSNWGRISLQYREKVEWKCEKCNIDFREKKAFLHLHHRNGLKHDNSERNLRALCIGCHAEEPQHQHLKSTPLYTEYMCELHSLPR